MSPIYQAIAILSITAAAIALMLWRARAKRTVPEFGVLTLYGIAALLKRASVTVWSAAEASDAAIREWRLIFEMRKEANR